MVVLPHHETTPRLLREPAARTYLGGMSHATFWGFRQSGVIPTLRVGKSIYFDRADLDRFIEAIREEYDRMREEEN